MVELKIHRGIKHHHICQFDSWFEDTENIYIILEFCPHEDLEILIKKRKILH